MTWPGDPLKGRARRKWRRWKKVVTSLQVLPGCCVCSMTPPCDRSQTHKHTYAFRPAALSYPVQHHSTPPGGSGDPQLAAHCLGRYGQEELLCHPLWVPVRFFEPSTAHHDLEDKVASSGVFQSWQIFEFLRRQDKHILVCSDQTVDSRQQDGFTLNVSSLILKAFSFLINLEIGMRLCECVRYKEGWRNQSINCSRKRRFSKKLIVKKKLSAFKGLKNPVSVHKREFKGHWKWVTFWIYVLKSARRVLERISFPTEWVGVCVYRQPRALSAGAVVLREGHRVVDHTQDSLVLPRWEQVAETLKTQRPRGWMCSCCCCAV